MTKNIRTHLSAFLFLILSITGVNLLSLALINKTMASDCENVLELEQGKVSGAAGKSLDYEFCSYKGIPYAQPPVGELRWQAPKKVLPHEGVLAATEFGDQCLQNMGASGAQSSMAHERISEDCLSLNIWRPTNTGEENLPVLFWIHGGALWLGSSAWDLYDGGIFAAKQNIILVSINYRLGYFGFLSHPSLIDENDGFEGGSTGSYGILDQVEALKWVNANIEHFGGDKNNVTIFGESAGGFSVSYLLAADAARPYFHKAILQSGGSEVANTHEDDMELGRQFSETFGCEEAEDPAACLRAIPGQAILDLVTIGSILKRISNKIWEKFVEKTGLYEIEKRPSHAKPRIDGVFLSDMPLKVFQQDDYQGVPFIGGFTEFDPDQLRIGSEVSTKVMAAKASSYLYRFDYAEHSFSGIMGGAHGMELPFVFDSRHLHKILWDKSSLYTEKQAKAGQPLADTIQAYWANFARTGDPNGVTHTGEALEHWPLYIDGEAIVFDKEIETVGTGEVLGEIE